MRWLLALCLAWKAALAQEEALLKVGKTPAEKLEQETQKAKDNVEAALQTLERRKQIVTQTFKTFESGPLKAPAEALPDPTQPDPEFQRQFRAMLRGKAADSGASALPPMPQIALAAKVEYRGRAPVALLRVDGKDVLVRQSDVLSWLSQGQPVTIQVREVNQHSVTVVLFPHNLSLTLH